jgi:hypothetical protein
LFSSVQSNGSRHVYEPLFKELERQREIMAPKRTVERPRIVGGRR